MTKATPVQTLETVLFGDEDTRLACTSTLEFQERFDHDLAPINAEYNLARDLLTSGEKIAHFIERKIKRSHKIHISKRSFATENEDMIVSYNFADIPHREGFTVDEPMDWTEISSDEPALHFLEIIFKNTNMPSRAYNEQERHRLNNYAIYKMSKTDVPDYEASDPRLRFIFKEVIWDDHIDPRPFDKRYIKTDDTVGINDYFDYKRFLLAYPNVHMIFSKDSYYNASQTVRSLQRLAFENVVSLASGHSDCLEALNDFHQGYLLSGPQMQKRINDSCLDTQYWQELSWMNETELAKELEFDAEALRIIRE